MASGNWQIFLNQCGANRDANTLIDFGDADAGLESATKNITLIPLSQYNLLQISGEDRQAFLHGQLITDVKQLQPMQSQYSGWCNARGQLIANLLLLHVGDHYLLLVNSELKDYVLKRLGIFILRADVNITDVTDNMPMTGIANIDQSSIDPDIETALDESDIVGIDQGFICRLPGEQNRYMLFAELESLSTLILSSKDEIGFAGPDAWQLLNIQAGIPWIGTTTQEQFLPQMLNLDQFDALSYQKGCYPGQEVIARLHYRGEVKKRIQLIHTRDPIHAGSTIKTKEGNKAGTVINAVRHPDSYYYALATLDMDKLDQELYAEPDKSDPVGVSALPYTVEN